MAAGLGFKTFATGDVLTAADTNGYLMQGVWVFADAAARTAAVTSPQEGNMSYLKDTNSLEYYSGTAWVAVDTSATVPSFLAGKNKIINGDFYVNQRAFSSATTTGTFNFDRWYQSNSGGTVTASAQTFTAGTAPVSGYEGKNFLRLVSASQSAAGDYAAITQTIESVRTFAGQTINVSFWAKASTGTPNLGISIVQAFGTGGSPSANVITSLGVQAITSSWARYTATVALPSISGKTLGTANDDKLQFNIWTSVGATISGLGYPAVGIQNVTVDFWGVQIEAGSTATPFTTATNTIQGELALCQRYYFRLNASDAYSVFGNGAGTAATTGQAFIQHPVTMRSKPTVIDYSAITLADVGVGAGTSGTFVINNAAAGGTNISGTGLSSLSANRPVFVYANNSTSAYIGLGAEL